MKCTGILSICLAASLLAACNGSSDKRISQSADINKLLDNYWEERMQLFPFEATANGDNRYNDRMTITIAESFRDSLGRFYQKYLDEMNTVDSTKLDETQLISYRLFKYEMEMGLEGLKYPTHLMPINQFWAFTLELPQYGSGTGNQPFKTVKDYDNFLKRMQTFPAWVDTCIANMRKGIQQGWVLPQELVQKMLPQMEGVYTKAGKESIFYSPITLLTDSVATGNEKDRLAKHYLTLVDSNVNPSYRKLHDFMVNEYLPAARGTDGISALPNGMEFYAYCAKQWTTTPLTPDSIYKVGEAEVARLEGEMNRIKDEVGFKGDLQAFFAFVGDDKQFYPFTTPQQVLDSYYRIKSIEEPHLKKIFRNTPKTPFTIRQTEAFRAASASAEYNPGSADGTRPGIFYVPILNAKKFSAVGMETLFLHEAIPGHHYQISLQQESEGLPKFRRFLWYGAYGEGWALYSETLGKELGLFQNPYQYFGHLSDAMHRAIRLVVDVGIHTKGMSREDAIKYMLAHERTSYEEAAAEIERYMAIPGQALSYKIGQLSISAQRKKYEEQLKDKFDLAAFHDEVLKHGCLPLNVLEGKLAEWAAKIK